MIDRLSAIRRLQTDTAGAIRWACILEAAAPKPGNVHPGSRFNDLCYDDFVSAAETSAVQLVRFDIPIGQRILACIQETRQNTGTNVNLGIVLLIAPLAQAHHDGVHVSDILQSLSDDDGKQVFQAIRTAGAGGLDSVDKLDIHREHDRVDLVQAMKLAADHDRIAMQYASGFDDLHRSVVPVLQRHLTAPLGTPFPNLVSTLNSHVPVEFAPTLIEPDLLNAIALAHLQLLADAADSLIARKGGTMAAQRVQRHAASLDFFDSQAVLAFDRWLRSDGNRRNPGTTADLIAAALFVLLTQEE